MTTVNVGTTKNTVTVNGETRVVTVKTGETRVVTVKVAGPQGPGFSDGNKGDVTIANNGASITINSGAVTSTKLANSGVTSGSYGSGSAIPTITVNDKGIVTSISTSSINTDLVADTSPQLGGNLDLNSNNITGTGDINITGDILISGTVDGRDLSADGSKLDGIESNATADQTKSDIDALGIAATTATTLTNARTIAGTSFDGSANIDISYANLTNKLSVGDGGLTQNNFTDTLKSKLDGIETAATADQTAAEIKTLLNSDGIVNAQIDASAAIAGSKISPDFGSQNISTTGTLGTGNITISKAFNPSITFNDGNNENDFEVSNAGGLFRIRDIDAGFNRFTISSASGGNSGVTSINNHLDVGNGLDVTGGDITGVLGSAVTGTTQSATDDSTKIATTAFVKTAVSNLVDSAPSTLDTLNELAAALGDDANFSTTVTNSIATKLPLAGGTLTGDLTINKNNPVITFSDDNNNPDYQVGNINGVLRFQDTTNNATRLQINTDGHVDFLTNVDFAGNITLADNGKIILGDGGETDSFISFDGTHLQIRETSTTGALRLDGHNIFLRNPTQNDEKYLFCNGGSTGRNVELYCQGTKRLETTSAGVNVTGTINSNNITITGSQPFLSLQDAEDENDYEVGNAGGLFRIRDVDAAVNRLTITSAGVTTIAGNLDVGTINSTGNINLTSTGASKIINSANNLFIQGGGGTLYLQAVNDANGIKIHPNDKVELFFDGATYGTAKLATSATGVNVNGDLSVTSATNNQLTLISTTRHSTIRMYDNAGSSFIQNRDGNMRFLAGGDTSGSGASDVLFINGALKRVGIGTTSVGATLHLSSTLPELRFTDTDNNNIDHFISCSGSAMTLKADESQEDNAGDTTIRFHIDTVEKGRFDDAGLDVTGSITIPDATITNGIPNNAIKIGDATDGDLMIYHDSNNSVIRDAGTGSLIFQSNQIVGYRYGTAEKLFQFDGLGAASLFHGGASTAKLATTATGATVNGELEIASANGGGGTPSLYVNNSSSRGFIHTFQGLTPNMTTNNKNILVLGRARSTKNAAFLAYKYSGTAGSNDNLFTISHWGADDLLTINGQGNTTIAGNLAVDTDTLFVDSTNDRVGINNASPTQALDVTGNIQMAGTGLIQIPDRTTSGVNELRFGNEADYRIYHNGTNAVMDNLTGALFLKSLNDIHFQNRTNDEIIASFMVDDACKLYYDGGSYTTPKLATDANGITVDGRVRLDKGDQLDFGDQFRVLRYTSQDTMTLQSPEDVVICIDNNANGNTNHKFAILKETTNPDNGTGTELFKVEETGNVTIAGDVVATGDGTFDDSRIGQWAGNSNFTGLLHKNHSGSEYMMISNGSSTSGHTYISATTGMNVVIRGGNNSNTNQIEVQPTGGINLTAANGVNILDGNIDFGSNADNNPVISMKGDNNRVKYRVFTNTDFGTGFSGNITHGGLNGFCMTFQVSDTANRGWLFLDSGHGLNQGAMALTSEGKMNLAHSLRLGYGESDTTSAGITHTLDVSGDANITGTLEAKAIRFGSSHVKRISVDYTGEETGGDGVSYLVDNEFQEILTITPSSASQNYSVIGRIMAASGANVHTIDINVALRSNTLPDLQVSGSYISTITGSHEFLTPRFWLKETTTAAFKLVVEINVQIFGRVTADLEIISRNEADLNNIVVNEDETSEVTSIPTGYAQTTPTKVYETDDGAFSFDGNLTVGGFIDLSTSTVPVIVMKTNNSRDKYRLWNSGTYAIGFDSGMTFGGLNDYATTFQMNSDSDRGWVFLDNSHTDAQGAMALTTEGKMTLAHSLRLGHGESDTTTPATSYTAGSENGHIAGSYRLDVKGKLRVETDDLGTTAGDQQELALFKTVPNSNRSFLSFFTQRDTNGTNWTTAYTRIQQFIDTTPMGYIQFNGTDNTNGMEFGRGAGGTKFIFCDFGGAVKLYHDGVERFSTDTTGANVLNGSLGTNDEIYMRIGRNEAANNTAIVGFKYSGTSGSNDNKAIIGVHGNRELITASSNAIALARNTTVTGTVTCTSLTETSDIALKENIQPLSNVLDKVKQLTGYKYNFKNKEKASMGVIAQDVEKVFPELVHGEEGKKSLQYSGLVGALIEAVKELSAKVAVLESK